MLAAEAAIDVIQNTVIHPDGMTINLGYWMAWGGQWGILDATASGVEVKSDELDSTGYVASIFSWFLRITRSTYLEFT